MPLLLLFPSPRPPLPLPSTRLEMLIRRLISPVTFSSPFSSSFSFSFALRHQMSKRRGLSGGRSGGGGSFPAAAAESQRNGSGVGAFIFAIRGWQQQKQINSEQQQQRRTFSTFNNNSNSKKFLSFKVIGGSTTTKRMPPTQQQQQDGAEMLHYSSMVVSAQTTQQSALLLEPQLGADQGILLAKMNLPRTKNALSKALVARFRDAVDQLRYDRGARVLIIQSAVPGTFCTGADLKERRQMSEIEVFQFVDLLRRTFNDISSLPFPVLAVIDGFALGGGLELAMACDIRISSPRSKLGLVETTLAIIPGAGGTQRLPRIVGLAKAKELIFTGKVLSGEESLGIGLVNHVVEKPLEKAMEIAREILKTGPIASKMAKIAIDRGSELELASGMVVEQQCYAQLMPTKDRLEALKAFAEKREPKYRGE